MRITHHRKLTASLIAAGAAATLAGGAAVADVEVPRLLATQYASTGDFYLTDETDVEVLDYQEPRDVRICNDTRRHETPLEVEYDDRTAIVRSGACFQFEAKTVSITPAKELEATWDLSGTVEVSGE